MMMMTISWCLLFSDKGAAPLLGFKQAPDFHLAIATRNRIWIDSQIDSNLANGRKLVACLQSPRRNRALHLVHQLPIHWHAAVRVQLKVEFIARF